MDIFCDLQTALGSFSGSLEKWNLEQLLNSKRPQTRTKKNLQNFRIFKD